MKKYLMTLVFMIIFGVYGVSALEIPVNSYVIGEYIDVLEDAQQLLHDYLEGILPAYDFQDYILDLFNTSPAPSSYTVWNIVS